MFFYVPTLSMISSLVCDNLHSPFFLTVLSSAPSSIASVLNHFLFCPHLTVCSICADVNQVASLQMCVHLIIELHQCLYMTHSAILANKTVINKKEGNFDVSAGAHIKLM